MSRRCRCMALAVAAGLAISPWGARAEEGPLVLSRRERAPFLTLDPFSGSLDLQATYQSDQTTSAGTQAKSSEMIFQETLGLSTSGGVVSKNFLEWNASVSAGLQQEFLTVAGQNETSNGVIYTYDMSATLLRSSELPASFFARRAQNLITRSFAPEVQQTIETYGVSLVYRPQPTTLRIYQTKTQQNELGGKLIYGLTEDNVELTGDYHLHPQHDLTFTYTYKGVDQTEEQGATNSLVFQDFNAVETYRLDPAGRYVLTSSLSYLSQTGQTSIERLRLDEYLRLKHDQSFESYYNATLDQQTLEDATTNSARGMAGFSHRLFESLTTNARVGAMNTSGDATGGTQEFFANVDWLYTKKVPFGVFSANLGFGFDNIELGQTAAGQDVAREAQSLPLLGPLVLRRTAINKNSIKVFDAAGFRQFTENLDYTVVQRGSTIEISPIVGGGSSLSPGDPVLLNYHVDPLPGYTSETQSLALGARYDINEGLLKGLSVYTRYRQQDQSISGTTSTQLIPDNASDTTFGAEYQFWKITLTAEQEFCDSSLAPFNALRFTARYFDNLDKRTTLSVTASQNFMEYPQDSRHTEYLLINGRLTYEISRNFRAIVTMTVRQENDSAAGRLFGVEGTGELNYTIRQTEMFMMVRQSMLSSPTSDDEMMFLQVGLRRRF